MPEIPGSDRTESMGVNAPATPAPGAPATPTPQPPAPKHTEIAAKLRSLLDGELMRSIEQDKIHEFERIRKNNAYYRGIQNVIRRRDPNTGTVDYVSVSGSDTKRLATGQRRRRPYDYNSSVYQGDVKKLIAVLGGKAPNMSCSPLIEGNEEHTASSRKAGELLESLSDILNINKLHTYLVYCLAVNGRAFSHAATETNERKYGTTSEPEFSTREAAIGPPLAECPHCIDEFTGTPEIVAPEFAPNSESGMDEPYCPQCLNPLDPASIQQPPTIPITEQTGTRTYKNAGTFLRLYSGLHVTTDFDIRDLDEASFLKLEYEADPGQIIAKYSSHPKIREIVARGGYGAGSSSSNASQTGRQTREEMGSATGYYRYARPGRCLYTCIWFPSSTLQMIDESQASSPVREYLLSELFPDGIKCVWINGELIHYEPASLTAEWAMCSPSAGEYENQLPWMQSMVAFQDIWNDIINIAIMLMERSLPYIFINNKVLDLDSLSKKRFLNFIPVKDLNDAKQAIYSTPAVRFDPLTMQLGEAMKETERENVGVLPPMFGAAGEDERTKGQAILRRNQAMKMLAILWSNILGFWARTMENAIVETAKYSVEGRVWFPRRGGRDPYPVDLGDLTPLLELTWVVEPDESVPMSAEERREYIRTLLESPNPELINLLGLTHPANLHVLQDAVSTTGLKSPQLEARDSLHAIIRQLVMIPPVLAPDPMTGQPVPRSPIPADPVRFDPRFAFFTLQEWLNSPEGGLEVEQANPDGFESVRLYAAEYKMIFEMSAMGPGAGVPALPPGEGAGGGNGVPGAPDATPVPETPGPSAEADLSPVTVVS